MKFSILSSQNTVYRQFRPVTMSKKIPAALIILLDFASVVVSWDQSEFFACLEVIRRREPGGTTT